MIAGNNVTFRVHSSSGFPAGDFRGITQLVWRQGLCSGNFIGCIPRISLGCSRLFPVRRVETSVIMPTMLREGVGQKLSNPPKKVKKVFGAVFVGKRSANGQGQHSPHMGGDGPVFEKGQLTPRTTYYGTSMKGSWLRFGFDAADGL